MKATSYRRPCTALCLILLLCTIPIHAAENTDTATFRRWYIGTELGYAYTMIQTSTGYRKNTSYQNGHGFDVSILAQYWFFDWLALQAGMRYIQKNYGWTHSYEGVQSFAEYTNHFVEFPISLRFSFGGSRFRGFADAGGYLGVWAGGSRRGRSFTLNQNPYTSPYVWVDYNETIEFDTVKDNRFDAGLLLGAGISYRFDPCTIYLTGCFQLGLTDLQKQYQRSLVSRFNDVFALSLGVLFNANIFRAGR